MQTQAFFHTMNTSPGTVGSDPVILATAGYDHTVRFWQAHSGICTRTVQHQDSVSSTRGRTPGGGASLGKGRVPGVGRMQQPSQTVEASRVLAPGLRSSRSLTDPSR